MFKELKYMFWNFLILGKRFALLICYFILVITITSSVNTPLWFSLKKEVLVLYHFFLVNMADTQESTLQASQRCNRLIWNLICILQITVRRALLILVKCRMFIFLVVYKKNLCITACGVKFFKVLQYPNGAFD